MSALALNLLLAILWVLLWADPSLAGLLVGLAVGLLAIVATQAVLGRGSYARRAAAAVRLAAAFVRELVRANLTLARDVLRRAPRFSPALLRVDVPELGPVETVLLANLVTLTPGTLTVDTDGEGGVIYVHSLYAADPEEVRRQIGRSAALIRAVSPCRKEGAAP